MPRAKKRRSQVRRERIASLLDGRYEVKRQLGRGAMAGVYQAERVSDGACVALKVLHPEYSVSVTAERFHREIEILKRLDHPHILPLLDSEQAGTLLFYVMPCADGEPLSELLVRERQLSLDRTLEIMQPVASALDYAHRQNVLHRDIKPGNILFDEGKPMLCDFGVARAIEHAGGERLSSSGLIVGTPAYMSPEQASGAYELDTRSDIYSLACVMYEMLVGEPPFSGRSAQAIMAKHVNERTPSVRVVRPDLPAAVEDGLQAALVKPPDGRPATASEFLERAAG